MFLFDLFSLSGITAFISLLGCLSWNLQLYRGTLQEAEDNMNCSMTNVTMTGRDGSITTLEQVFIRGGLINFVIIPDILKNAPMFKRIDPKQGILRGKGVGIGRATVNRARSVLATRPCKPSNLLCTCTRVSLHVHRE